MKRLYLALFGILALASLPGCDDDEDRDAGSTAGTGASGKGGSGTGGSGSGKGGSGAGGFGQAGYAPAIDPADFSTTIDNPLLPWLPGMVLSYVEDEDETVTITVTDETETIMGVECVVVHDEHIDDAGKTIEDTYDWYAQDSAGNVWYFGEDTVEYDSTGNADPAGSWEAGVDGAQPGIAMPAAAVVGEPYRQEYYADEAEDWGQIIEIDVDITLPAGAYTGCIRTKDWSGLEPEVIENKVYCPGVGNVQAEVVEGGDGLQELTSAVIP